MGALAELGGQPGLAENSTYRFTRAATSILWGQSAAAGALRLFLLNRIFPHLGRSMAWWKRTPTLRQLESSFEPTPGTRTRTKATTMLRKNHFSIVLTGITTRGGGPGARASIPPALSK